MGGARVAADDVLLEMKAGGGRALLEAIARRKMAAARAEQEGLTADEDEVEQELAAFYADRDLFEPEAIAGWLQAMRLGEESIRAYLRERLLAGKLRLHLGAEAAVEARFRSELPAHARAEVEVFAFPSEGAALEFMLAVREREIEPAKGGVRSLTPRTAPEVIAAALLGAEAGELLGPVETEAGAYEVFRLLRRDEPCLDPALKEAIRDAIVDEALAPARARARLTFEA
jgi:hypothetical protein